MARCSILTLVALLACAAVCHAQKWTAMADAANQIPALTDEEVGGAMATFNMWATEEGMLEYSLEVSDITNLTMAHIHIGNSTESGAVAVQLVPEDTSTPMLATPVSGAFSIASAMIDTSSLGGMTLSEFLDAADTEGLYVNLHTDKYPGGAIRGQVMPVPDLEFMADLSGENQPEPLTDVGSGTFMMTAGEDGTYTWELKVKDVTNLTMAHIHIGNSSASGPVAVALLPTDGEAMFDPPQTGSKTYTGNFTSADIMELTPEEFRADLRINTEMNFYVNLHSTEYPAGVIRGQLMWMNDMAMAPAEAPMAADEAMEAPAGAPGSSATTASFNAAVMLAAALLAAVML